MSPITATGGLKKSHIYRTRTVAIREIRSGLKSTEDIKNFKMSRGNWQNLPHHVFGDIMTMMGRERLNDLQQDQKSNRSDRQFPKF